MQRDRNSIPAVVYKILDQMEPRILANNLRTFADYLVDEFNDKQHEAMNYINLLLYMIWNKVIFSTNKNLWSPFQMSFCRKFEKMFISIFEKFSRFFQQKIRESKD
jgi:hypothetical protein